MQNKHYSAVTGLTALCLCLCVTLALAGCGEGTTIGFPSSKEFSFSFESGLDGFSADGTDLEVGGSEIDWSIAGSTDFATDGTHSAKLYANNLTDAAKIWLEKPLSLEPNTSYSVDISFDFATADAGDFNHWTIVAGLVNDDPEVSADINQIYQGDTAAQADLVPSHIWLPKTYHQEITTDGDGKAWLTLGVWGTWETARTYYIDKVRITATPPQ